MNCAINRRVRSYLVVWQDDECPAARRLDDNGEKFGIDGAECGVPTALRHANVVVALLALHRLPVHMTEL